MLNPKLDIDRVAAEYALDDRVRVLDVLDSASAERVHTACRDDVPYEYLCHVNGNNVAIPPGDLKAMSRDDQRELDKVISEAASRGVGFFYAGYQMRRAQDAAGDARLGFLHDLFDFVNSDEVLSTVSAITGRSDIRCADAHFTRFTAGQFLTRHKDDIRDEGRLVAYVMGFSKDWHPDWGGLLHFFDDDGTPRDFWVPTFNSLALFDVRHVHSVSFVTPFAQQPRLSLTGWFCR